MTNRLHELCSKFLFVVFCIDSELEHGPDAFSVCPGQLFVHRQNRQEAKLWST